MKARERGNGKWKPPRAAVLGAFLLIVAVPGIWTIARGEDVVELSSEGRRDTTRVTGEIVEYTGERLVLRRVGGREETFDSRRVVRVQGTWIASQKSADMLFDSGKYDEALNGYAQALKDESRGWVRRRIVAQSIWCLRYLNQDERAIDLFLALYRQDPKTIHFDGIPLAWLTRLPAAAVERRSRELIDANGAPVEMLIGASWLLPTSQRAKALGALRGLVGAEDSRIAFLADAQLWRSQLATARPEDVSRWQERVDRMPPEIRAGPTMLVAQALVRLARQDDAALTFLRVPILYPLHRDLAAHSLWEAAQLLDKADDRDGAVRLYDEVIERHPGTIAADEARRARDDPAQPATTGRTGESRKPDE